jgi:hypothetical protein
MTALSSLPEVISDVSKLMDARHRSGSPASANGAAISTTASASRLNANPEKRGKKTKTI